MTPEAPRGYVVDTNVLSNRGGFQRNQNLVKWLQHRAGSVRVSVVTVAEMHRGLILLEAKVALLADRGIKAREQQRIATKRA